MSEKVRVPQGFTGHEMLDSLDLVHMNGRVYDPFIARFMSADVIIQAPEHSQSYNRYTYVWNNPTNLTDPTGFQAQAPNSVARQICEQGIGCQVKDGQIVYTDPFASNSSGNSTTEATNSGRQSQRDGKPNSANSGSQVAKNLILGTETALTGGYGHRMKEAWDNGDYGWAAGNLVMGAAYGGMNLLTLGQLGAANTTAQLSAREAAALSAALGENLASKAVAPIEKFSGYIFKEGADHGKDAVFRSLGFDASHSAQLAKIWERQAAEKFAKGEYVLGKADKWGQRIDIRIDLNGIGNAAGKTSHIKSGWMLLENGTIRLNTPFSGFMK